MKYIIPILTLCFFAACNTQEIEKTDFSKITLIDTFDNELVLYESHSIRRTRYYPLYIGKYEDTVTLKYITKTVNSLARFINVEYKYPDSSSIKVFVDTSKIIGSGIGLIPPPLPPLPFEKEIKQEYIPKLRGKYKSYPVFIENISKDTVTMGAGNVLPAPILEALDSNGIWKPIQRSGIYSCGTGLKQFHLLPDEVLITHCYLYEGNYKTKLRIVEACGRMFKSNEFEGRINYEQFGKGY